MSDYLYLANVSVCAQEEIYFKLKQIADDEYTWLSEDAMLGCMATLDRHLGSSEALRVEHVLVDKTNEMEMQRRRIDQALFPYFGHELRFKFVARADVVTSDTLWEIKCVSKLTIDHMMQTAIYAWLLRVVADPDKEDASNMKCKILNARTGEVRRLEASTEDLALVVRLLLRNKFSKPLRLSDDDFLLQQTGCSNKK